jgi:Subtilase family
MNCFEPGQLIVLPSKDSGSDALLMMGDRLNQPFEIIYAIEDVLKHYGLGNFIDDMRHIFGPLPVVVRVPEGEELSTAARLIALKEVAASVPNLHVNAASTRTEIHHPWVDLALRRTNAQAASQQCGTGVRVAILDTGVDPTALVSPGSLLADQYDAERPADLSVGLAPRDDVGHGTVVAHIVNRIAPGATLQSIKTFSHGGTIGSVLAALYLAEASFKPDIYNLSLSLSCDPELCEVCGNPKNVAINAAQVGSLFSFLQRRQFPGLAPPVLIAAAGNRRTRVSLPAAFPFVIAVGALDMNQNCEADYSRYESVPPERYVMAPGGNQWPAHAIATVHSESWKRTPTLFGTSFSTAFVTGICARYLCAYKGQGPCGGRPHQGTTDVLLFLVSALQKSADQSITGYSASRHGIGVARYDISAVA